MTGKQLAWPLLLVLGLALAAQTVRWQSRWQAGRGLYDVQLRTSAAFEADRASRKQYAEGLVARNLADLDRVAKRAPAEIRVPFLRGSQYFVLGSYDRAISTYETALRQEPRPEVFYYLGRAQYAAGRREEAKENFAKAVQLDPRLASAVPK